MHSDHSSAPDLRIDQACKECIRRRAAASCDKGIPQCSTCVRTRRHCLYERHARTPLTRKHLTQVETRLERAEALLKYHAISLTADINLERPKTGFVDNGASKCVEASTGKVDTTNSVNSETPATQSCPVQAVADDNRPSLSSDTSQWHDWINNYGSSNEPSQNRKPSVQIKHISQNGLQTLAQDFHPSSAGIPLYKSSGNTSTDESSRLTTGPLASTLETPPDAPEDLAWDELTKPMVFGDAGSWRQDLAHLKQPSEEDSIHHVLDGMAMLSVEGRDIGYMGVASGAAFLRYLYRPSGGSNSPRTSKAHRQYADRDRDKLPAEMSMHLELDSRQLIADSFVDAYFSLFHFTLPILHEPTFRAILYGNRPRPKGATWTVLANIVAAIGAFSAMTECLSIDTPIFYAAKSALSMDCLETGNLMLVQALTLMSYYFQKRNKPNSGYTYAGLAARMAFGLGLHREFPSWKLAPHKREVRRRVFWSAFIVDASICVTLSRPFNFVSESTDIPLPLNVSEATITESSTIVPPELTELTIYSSLRAGATFYLAADSIYKRLIKHPYPDLEELIRLDDQCLMTWQDSQPLEIRSPTARAAEQLSLMQLIIQCRYRNLKLVMFRPFLIPLLQHTSGFALPASSAATASESIAYTRCMAASQGTISAISEFWHSRPRTRLAAWYILYFSFQATLIPLVCLRSAPFSAEARMWRADIRKALNVIEDIRFIHGKKCASVIHELSDPYMSSRQEIFTCKETYSNVEHAKTEAMFDEQAERYHTNESNSSTRTASSGDMQFGKKGTNDLQPGHAGYEHLNLQQCDHWGQQTMESGRMLEAQDFSMLFPTDGQFDLESDAAWHMVWPDASAPENGDMFGIIKGENVTNFALEEAESSFAMDNAFTKTISMTGKLANSGTIRQETENAASSALEVNLPGGMDYDFSTTWPHQQDNWR